MIGVTSPSVPLPAKNTAINAQISKLLVDDPESFVTVQEIEIRRSNFVSKVVMGISMVLAISSLIASSILLVKIGSAVNDLSYQFKNCNKGRWYIDTCAPTCSPYLEVLFMHAANMTKKMNCGDEAVTSTHSCIISPELVHECRALNSENKQLFCAFPREK